MKWNNRVRQTHRWVSFIFTLLVIANVIINLLPLGTEDLALMLGFITLVPLVFLLLTGIYLFILPYAAKSRSERQAS